MAFYRDMQKKGMSRQEHMKKDWNAPEEGSRYSGKEHQDSRRADSNRPYDSKNKNGGKRDDKSRQGSYRGESKTGYQAQGKRTQSKPYQGEHPSSKSYQEKQDSRPISKPYQERQESRTVSRPYQGNRPASAPYRSKRESRHIPDPVASDPSVQEFDTPYTREPENLLSGRNPIREALKSGRDIEKLMVAKGDLSGSAREIVSMAREKHIPVQVVDRSRLDEITHNHQGMLAFASAYQYSDVDSMLALAKERGEQPFLIILDGVTDPHNLGAIIRTAACVGAHGVIVPQRRAVGLTPAAVKASAGAVETIKVARVGNLVRTIQDLKKAGVWVYAADMEGEDYRTLKMEVPMALVIGSEGDGISRLVLSEADYKVKLPMYGGVSSLNASVAAGILMYAAVRGRE